MTEKNQAALILEGGATRGVFTAGVLDYLMEMKTEFPYVTGVSAGACNAVDYVSRQPGRTKQCMILEDKQYRYISVRKTIRNRSLFDMDMIFDRYPNEIFPFDFDTYFNSDTCCELVVTNCLSGKAEYLTEKSDRKRLMDICRASSSVPAACPMVMVDGHPCLDGGISDSIPVIHAVKKGYRKNVVVLTRNYGYRKKRPGKSRAFYMAAFKEYPNLLNTLLNRYRVYNRTLEIIEKWEKEGHIFVIRPQMETVSRTEQNTKVLTEFYQHGYDVMEQQFQAFKEYLECEC
ncbi:MAG: patatin family protein [Eubacteriales bacterium]|nr:patatin family protein [Eubacteriales bacterium]